MASAPLRLNREPGFFWQGLLILLPVGLLAGVATFSLRHDRLVAEHEAKQRAQAIAETLAPKLWSELVLTNVPPPKGIAFLVDTNSRLVSPPACAITPSPAGFDSSILNSNQARLWALGCSSEVRPEASATAIGAYRELATLEPPPQFAAATLYALGLLLETQGDREGARMRFQALVDNYPGSLGESGLPLEPLARFRLLELELTSGAAGDLEEIAAVEALCSNVVWQPTPLSAEILRRAGERTTTAAARLATAAWQRTWDEHEIARDSYSTLLRTGALTNDQLMERSAIWCMADENWLVMKVPTTTGTWYSCRSEGDVSAALTKVAEREKQVPEYFGIGIDLSGKRLTWPAPNLRMWDYVNYFGRKGGGQKKQYLEQTATNVLASAEPEGPGRIVRASVYLTSPGALFARESARLFWVAALIASAAIAAGVGFFTAYRAFYRQLRLSEMKSNFVSSVSHELRAPIASVRLMAESLEKGKVTEPAKQQEYFRFIRQECRRLSSLVENVLDFSRIEQGRKQYEFEPTNVVTLTGETVKLMQTYAEEKGVRLEVNLPEPSSFNAQPVLDGKAIQQALINLIDNALKHSAKGETVLVGLETRRGIWAGPSSSAAAAANPAEETAEGTVLLWVEDRGPGIPQSEQQKIFERFYRLGSELRRETQGVGIGLSIVKHVVEAHGGRVLVRSDVGQGSRFTIELPVRSGNDESQKST